MKIAILISIIATLTPIASQKVFQCFYYFPDDYAVYNLKDLRVGYANKYNSA